MPSPSDDSIPITTKQALADVTAAADAVDAAQEALWATHKTLGEATVVARETGATIKAIAASARRPEAAISNTLAARASKPT